MVSLQPSSQMRLEQFMMITRMNFAEFLSTYLAEKGRERRDLYRYVQLHGIDYDFTTMDKYFNPNPKVNRIPRGKQGRLFIELFAQFLKLNEFQTYALIDLWEFKRKYRTKQHQVQSQQKVV